MRAVKAAADQVGGIRPCGWPVRGFLKKTACRGPCCWCNATGRCCSISIHLSDEKGWRQRALIA